MSPHSDEGFCTESQVLMPRADHSRKKRGNFPCPGPASCHLFQEFGGKPVSSPCRRPQRKIVQLQQGTPSDPSKTFVAIDEGMIANHPDHQVSSNFEGVVAGIRLKALSTPQRGLQQTRVPQWRQRWQVLPGRLESELYRWPDHSPSRRRKTPAWSRITV